MKIEFFHDVVCGWCYIQSSVLRKCSEEIGIKVVHRNFILQRNDHEMISKWGSLDGAKEIILQHWQSCADFEGIPERFNIDGMRKSTFNYPNGQLSAQATKAAELIYGQEAHWNMFDKLQSYHLKQAKNVGDIETIKEAVKELDFDVENFIEVMFSDCVSKALKEDLLVSFSYGVQSIPTIVIDEKYKINSTTRYQDLLKCLLDLKKS